MWILVENLWITGGVIPKKTVDKGVVIPRKNMQYKMNIMICCKINTFYLEIWKIAKNTPIFCG